MNIKFDGKKWSIDTTFKFKDLMMCNSLVALIAEQDIGHNAAQYGNYQIVEGDLYYWKFLEESLDNIKEWWFYDPSVRRWSKCDDPTEK